MNPPPHSKRQQRIREEILALYHEPEKSIASSRKRVASWQTLLGWQVISFSGIIIFFPNGWLAAALAFLLGLGIGVLIWLRAHMNQLPTLLDLTKLKSESMNDREPDQP